MHDDIRLKVHVVLESSSGERIAEIDNEFVVPNGFDEASLRTEEATVARALECRVLSPARALVRAHVQKQLEKLSFRRRVTPPGMGWPDDSGVRMTLDEKLVAIMARSQG